MDLPFHVEGKVRCRNQVWEVLKITDNQDGTWVIKLFPENESKPQSFLYPHTPIEPIKSALEQLESGRIDHIDHYRLLTNATRLSLIYEYDKLLSISNSKMVPEPYQLLAVKKVMESLRQRFLIADDVGLGKTIEAGLIMQELTARQRGNRVLIVTPASLQDQWKKEMQRHFHRTFYIYNSRKMEGIQELVDENLNPWLAKNSIITSIDWIKPQYEGSGTSRRNLNRIFDQLMKVEKPWDLIIMDEAHYSSTESNRADLAKDLQEKSDSLLLLTATPHSGNPEHFFNLLNLIDPFMFSVPEDLDRSDARERIDKVMIRRGKETIFEIKNGELVKKFRDREPQSIEISFSKEEKDLYDAVSQYTAEGWAELTRKRKITEAERYMGKFLLTLVQKRAVSSFAALRETLHRRIDSIVETRTVERIEGRESRELNRLLKDYRRSDYMEDDDREAVERYLETRKIQAVYAERTNEVKILREFLEKADQLIESGRDSKMVWLREFLRKLFANDPNEKVIVFTEYRDTLNYIQKKLEREYFLGPKSIVVIHGGMPLGEDEYEEGSKLFAERRFNDPDTCLLLATDAASEGLNLQRYCHIMVNYELPWNPNRLEQRIGRIHRYGQRQIARIYNLMIKGSKEAEIFKLLQDKIEVIRKQLGNMAEVLGVLERIPLDDLILRVLDHSVSISEAGVIAKEELKRMDEIARSIQKTQFLSGCRQFTREDIHEADKAIASAQSAIPQHKDVRLFVETFLHVYGDQGPGEKDGRKLHTTSDSGVFRLLVPSVVQDDKLPKFYDRITFSRDVASDEWPRHMEPEFIAFGHPLLDRMVHYCRVSHATELGGKLTCMVADYAGLPGIICNFLLRFEDKEGRIIREELEPIFIDVECQVSPELGRKLFLAANIPQTTPNGSTLNKIRAQISQLQQAAVRHIHSKYQDYYKTVEQKRDVDITILLEDLERFSQGTLELLRAKLKQLGPDQGTLFGESSIKGQRTRIQNQIKIHEHRMQERKDAIEKMRLGAFPAPELLNMIIVTPA